MDTDGESGNRRVSERDVHREAERNWRRWKPRAGYPVKSQ